VWKDNPATSLHILFNPECRLHLFEDETDVSNAGEQLARDKSPGDEVIRFNHAGPDNNWDSAFLFWITLEPHYA
jgi:hypothetical protein